MKISRLILILVVFTLVSGCSGLQNPVDPSGTSVGQGILNPVQSNSNPGKRVVWGVWKIRFPYENSAVEIIPDRTTALHFNCVRLLEVEPCSNCLTIENINFPSQNEITADFRIHHPYPGLVKMTGFDVRGIFIGPGDFTFPESGRIAAIGDDVPRLLNPDGHTQLFNPTEYPEGATPYPALAYITGKYSTGGDLSATLNPYIAYKQDAPRRHFEAGSAETKPVHLWRPMGPIEFGYAVDASWMLIDQVVDPVTDFPPEANAIEAYKIVVQGGDPIELSGCDPEEIFVEIFDHQGLETISTVTVESPDLFSGAIPLDYGIQMSDESWLFSGEISNSLNTETGEYPLLVRVEDSWLDGNLGVVDGWQIGEVTVNEAPETGWVRTWGGTIDDQGHALDIDHDENIYVTGYTTSGGIQNGLLAKYTSSGVLLWMKEWVVNGSAEPATFGGTGGNEIIYDQSGYIYVVGHFRETTDLDPGPEELIAVSNGESDVFLSKFTTDGDLEWAVTFGGPEHLAGFSVTLDEPGDVYIAGLYMGTVDFNPGPEAEVHTSNGSRDVFLSKFNSSGDFIWNKVWGGPAKETSQIGVEVDDVNNIYVSGCFKSSVDFDPGPDQDIHSSVGSYDSFVSKFDSEGNYFWVRTWGGSSIDWPTGVFYDGLNSIYLTGHFYSTADFDPGPGEDLHTSNGGWDIFISKLNLDGNFQWARTWGGDGSGSLQDTGTGLAFDSSGYLYATGAFRGLNVDFDPGDGIDLRNSNGERDAYLSKFDPVTGNFIWSQVWGGSSEDDGWRVVIPSSDNIYLAGYFGSSVNFAPDDSPCSNDPDLTLSNGALDGFLIKFLPNGCW